MNNSQPTHTLGKFDTAFDSNFTLAFNAVGTALFYIIYLVIAAGSVIGNFLVIFAFKNDKSLRRKPTNTFLASLAVTDFFTGLIAIPSYAASRTIVSELTCSGNTRYLLFLPGMVCGVSSITHLSLIAIDRYIAISRPLQYTRLVTKRRCFVSIILGTAFAILACVWPSFSIEESDWFCGEKKKTEVVSAFVLILCIIIILYFGVMIFCYVCMIRKALKHLRLRRNLSNSIASKRTNQEDAKSRLRATITVAIIMGAFIVCWAPIIFKFLFQSFFQYSAQTFLIVQVTCEIPFYANSMVNPIIYGYRNEHFRVGYKRALHHCFPCIVGPPPERQFSFISNHRMSSV